MLPLLFGISALLITGLILKPFSNLNKLLMLSIVLIYIIALFIGHYMIVERTGRPVIYDISVDAARYYEQTIHFTEYPPFSLTKADLIHATNKPAHLGYHYFLGTLATISSNYILLGRLLKALIYFLGLSLVVRTWRKRYGETHAFMAFIFMSVLYIIPFYYIYRNLKDGLLLGLFLICMPLIDKLLEIDPPEIIKKPSIYKKAGGWALLIILLWMISTIRYYLAFVIGVAIILHLLTNTTKIPLKTRISFLLLTAIIAFATLTSKVGSIFFETAQEQQVGRGVYNIYGIFRGVVAPIPWQYWRRGLIPSHSFYLLLLPLGFFGFLMHFRKHLTWHFYTFILLLYVVGGLIFGNVERKRLTLVPIVLMWALALFKQRQEAPSYQSEYYEQSDSEPIEEEIAYY